MSRLTEIEERPIQEALACIEAWLPPAGVTSMPEEPIKPAQANELHRAFRTLNRAPADIEYLLGVAKALELAQRALVSVANGAESNPPTEVAAFAREAAANALRALHPDPGEEA